MPLPSFVPFQLSKKILLKKKKYHFVVKNEHQRVKQWYFCAILLVFSVYYACKALNCVVFPAGVSARSFHQCFNLCSSVFNLQTATPGVRKHTLHHLTNHCLFFHIRHSLLDVSHFYLTGEDNRLCGCGWQHSPMGARVQRQTLRQPGQTGVYRWCEICLLLWNWVHKCIYANQDVCDVSGARYQALLIPDCPGALNDLAHSGSLARILSHFISQQSEGLCISNTQSFDTKMWDWFV